MSNYYEVASNLNIPLPPFLKLLAAAFSTSPSHFPGIIYIYIYFHEFGESMNILVIIDVSFHGVGRIDID